MKRDVDAKAIEAIALVFGLKHEPTGGGCDAFIKHFAGGIHVVVTDGEMPHIPDSEQFAIGIYDADGDPIDGQRYGEGVGSFTVMLKQALELADKLVPTTDDLSRELEAWCKSNGREPQCADELLHELRHQVYWLEDFEKRWNEIQELEDFEQACARRA